MCQYRTIVVGMDFSESAQVALAVARRLVAAEGGRVMAVEVVERQVLERQIAYHKLAAEHALEGVSRHLEKHLQALDAGAEVRAKVRIGKPWEALCDAASEFGADMLVLGARGHGEPGTVGTVAARCARLATVPVLLVRRGLRVKFRRVVVGTDFSAAATAALRFAAALARHDGAELEVVHVDLPLWMQPVHVRYELAPPPGEDYREEYRAGLREKLERYIRGQLGDDLAASTPAIVLEGAREAAALAEYLHNRAVDLVALGASGHGAVRDWLLGSTAEQLIRRSPCSVLTVPAGATP